MYQLSGHTSCKGESSTYNYKFVDFADRIAFIPDIIVQAWLVNFTHKPRERVLGVYHEAKQNIDILVGELSPTLRFSYDPLSIYHGMQVSEVLRRKEA